MKRTLTIIIILLAITAGFWFYKSENIVKNTPSVTQQFSGQLKHDPFPLRETYQWRFFLGPVEQISTHMFFPSYIDYRMRGKVHSTDYRMNQLSYDAEQKKWIGETKDGLVYVMFFQEIDQHNISIYKRKCKTGLSEAIAFQRPPADATADHGWNTYTLQGAKAPEDLLPLSGNYKNAQQTISLSDPSIKWQGKTYQKLTHHLGEKRWVGQLDDSYLLLFYELPESDQAPLSLSIQSFSDIEQAYKAKHKQQQFNEFQKIIEQAD